MTSSNPFAGLLAVFVLVTGLFAVFVYHAPPTTWAVPVQAGLLDDMTVSRVNRTETDVRLEIIRDEVRHTVRITDRWHPDGPPRRETARTRLHAADDVPDLLLDAVQARIEASEASFPPPPAFVRAPGAEQTPLQDLELGILQVLLVLWIAGLVWSAPALWRSLESPIHVLAAVALVVAAQQALVHGLELGGVWHSNFHGFDRIADVQRGTPPAVASLGLLHGYGYQSVMQPLHRLTGWSVFSLATALMSGVLLMVFAWLRLFWSSPRAALLGTLALAGMPVILRIGATESMYVPALFWIVATLWLFELHLQQDRARWFLLGLVAAFIAVQTRAELMVVLPGWLLLSMLLRRPGWLATGLRRPAIVLGVLGAGALVVPRLIELRAAPPPADLRRAAFDPAADPRLLVLGALALLALVALKPVQRRLRVVSAYRGVRAAAVLLVLGLGVFVGWSMATRGGPLERTWQLHAAFDPLLTSPLWSLLILAGGGVAWRSMPRRAAFLILAWVGAMWLYLPQYDCLSTYVRTSLTTWPLLAALAGLALEAVMAWSRPAGWALALLSWLGGMALGLDWMTHRYPKQLQGELLKRIRHDVPEHATLVWLSESDGPPDDVRVRRDRLKLGHVLGPGARVRSLDAWLGNELADVEEVWFVRTADCHRVLLDPRGDQAWSGEGLVSWRYLDVGDVSTGARIEVDVSRSWMEPRCAFTLASATAAAIEIPLPRENAGSVYETLVGRDPFIGLYRLPSTPRLE